MARRIKSLAHGVTDADPYEPYHTKVSPFHREHRSKRGRRYVLRRDKIKDYKKKLEELKLQELEDETEETKSQ